MAHSVQHIEQDDKTHQNNANGSFKKVSAARGSRARIEMRIDSEIKKMAERASAALGYVSLTEYLTSLIRDHATTVLEHEAAIQVTNAQFDHFMQVCDDSELVPGEKLLEAAKKLDTEGY